MGYRNLYVRKSDETFWSRAEEMAGRRRTNLSKLVGDLVRQAVIDDSSNTPVYLVEPKDAELEDALNDIRKVLIRLRDGEAES